MRGKGMTLGRRARPHLLGALFLSGVLSVLVAACGITLSARQDDGDIFKRLRIEGDLSPGGLLTMTLEYEQPYAVAVKVECALLDVNPTPTPTAGATPTATQTPDREATPTPVVIPRPRETPEHKVRDLIATELPANPEGGPADKATPVPGAVDVQFSAPLTPGDYVVQCLTPDDVTNSIARKLTVPAQ